MGLLGWPNRKKTGMSAFLEELGAMEAMAREDQSVSQGRAQEAVSHSKKAVDLAAAKGDVHTQAQCLALIGAAYASLKSNDAATYLQMQRGLETVRAMGAPS